MPTIMPVRLAVSITALLTTLAQLQLKLKQLAVVQSEQQFDYTKPITMRIIIIITLIIAITTVLTTQVTFVTTVNVATVTIRQHFTNAHRIPIAQHYAIGKSSYVVLLH